MIATYIRNIIYNNLEGILHYGKTKNWINNYSIFTEVAIVVGNPIQYIISLSGFKVMLRLIQAD